MDADVAAMVTESASASALIQRLGRLNRRGRTTGQATIVRDQSTWLYAEDEPLAWAWLRSREGPDGRIDVSVAALDGDVDRPKPIRTEMAPALTSHVIELLAQTAPRPGSWEEPNVETFLRGIDASPSADVALCWRADLRPELTGQDADDYREKLLKLVPPQPQELLTLSISGARALLASLFPGADRSRAARLALLDADIEGEAVDPQVRDPAEDHTRVPFVVVRSRDVLRGALGDNDLHAVLPTDLQPGDVVVLPAGANQDDRLLGALSTNDVAADLVPGDIPLSPVRITRDALNVNRERQMRKATSQRIAELCSSAENAVARARKVGSREAAVARLVEGLRAVLPGNAALDRLALKHADQRIVLRAIGPSAEDDVALLRELDEAADDGEHSLEATTPANGELDSGQADTQAAIPLERSWILVPLSNAHRDHHDRVPTASPRPQSTHMLERFVT